MARRGKVAPQARYDAAGNGRRIRQWTPPSTGPVKAVEGLQKIRDRARDTVRNDWAGASAVQKWATNLIGVGITPRWKDTKFRKLWDGFVKDADADGVLDLYGMQTLAVRAWFDGGEVFLRRRPRDLTLPIAAPVQFQLLESDFIPVFDSDAWQGMPDGNTIRQGIERNKWGRRVAYWVYKQHPGDKPASPTVGDLIRVAASDMLHMFEPKRAGQLRGVSELAAVLVRLRSTMDFEDAVLDRQKLANLFVAFITRSMPANEDIEFDPVTGLPKFYGDGGTPMASLEPGMTQELAPGESVTFANPPEAGTTFSEYLRTTGLGTAAGTGLPYEIMSGDIQNVSDRTLRVVIQEFRRLARQRQWQIVIPMLCQPMVEWWADAAALAGDLALSDLDAAKTPTWSPEGWEYIHPVQDATGKAIEVLEGFRSRSNIISERGDDPRDVDAERAADLARDKEYGLHSGAPVPVAPVPGSSGPAPAPKPKAAADVDRMVEMLAQAHAVILALTEHITHEIKPAPTPVALDVLPTPIVNPTPAN